MRVAVGCLEYAEDLNWTSSFPKWPGFVRIFNTTLFTVPQLSLLQQLQGSVRCGLAFLYTFIVCVEADVKRTIVEHGTVLIHLCLFLDSSVNH